jgi:hypothetical protein
MQYKKRRLFLCRLFDLPTNSIYRLHLHRSSFIEIQSKPGIKIEEKTKKGEDMVEFAVLV